MLRSLGIIFLINLTLYKFHPKTLKTKKSPSYGTLRVPVFLFSIIFYAWGKTAKKSGKNGKIWSKQDFH